MTDPQTALRAKILDALNGNEVGTDAVMRLFAFVEDNVSEHDTSAMGDAHRHVSWTRFAVARCVLERGSYVGAPRVDPPPYVLDGAL